MSQDSLTESLAGWINGGLPIEEMASKVRERVRREVLEELADSDLNKLISNQRKRCKDLGKSDEL